MSFPIATKHTKPNPKRKHGVLTYWTLTGHPGEWHYVEQLPHNRINDPQASGPIFQHKVASISTAQGTRYALFSGPGT